MTTTEAALREIAEQARNFTNRIAHGCWGNGYITEAKEVAHRLAVALSQPPASSTAGESDYKRGIYAAKCWLRDQQHKNPPDSLWHAAAILADRMDVALLSPSSGEPASVAPTLVGRQAVCPDCGKAGLFMCDHVADDPSDILPSPASVAVEAEDPCPVCGNEVRGQGGYLQCECPAVSIPLSKPTPVEDGLREAAELLKRVKAETIGPLVGGSDGGTFIVRTLTGRTMNDITAFLAALSETRLDAS